MSPPFFSLRIIAKPPGTDHSLIYLFLFFLVISCLPTKHRLHEDWIFLALFPADHGHLQERLMPSRYSLFMAEWSNEAVTTILPAFFSHSLPYHLTCAATNAASTPPRTPPSDCQPQHLLSPITDSQQAPGSQSQEAKPDWPSSLFVGHVTYCAETEFISLVSSCHHVVQKRVPNRGRRWDLSLERGWVIGIPLSTTQMIFNKFDEIGLCPFLGGLVTLSGSPYHSTILELLCICASPRDFFGGLGGVSLHLRGRKECRNTSAQFNISLSPLSSCQPAKPFGHQTLSN